MIDSLSKEELIELVNSLTQENQKLKEKLYGHKTEEINNIKENIYISNEDKVKFKRRIVINKKKLQDWFDNNSGRFFA